ncbi:MAG: pitrilysin family protein [Bacteroidota bacterium]
MYHIAKRAVATVVLFLLSEGYHSSMPPPQPKPAKKISFPTYITTDLANGLRILIIEHHEQPLVSFRFLVKSGCVDDGGLPGLASLAGELLTKGTKSRPAVQIAEEIDYVGGQLVSGADWDATYANATVLKKHLDVGLSLLGDVTLNPIFAEDEVERARQQRLTTLLQRKDEAGYLAEVKLTAAVFEHHPYANPQIGTEQSVKALKREDFLRFHQTHFVPNNALLAVVGDITAADMMPKVESIFGGWKRQALPNELIQNPSDLERTAVHIVDKPGAVQSAIRVGHVGIARKSEDFVPVAVLNTLLGGYFNSRINLNLREGKGYTYGAQTTFDVRKFRGPFVASADVRNAVTDSAITEVLYELERIRKEPVTPEELDMVKRFIVGSFPLQIETPNQIASKVIDLELYDLPRDFYDTFNDHVERIGAQDILRVAQACLHPDRVAIVVSGNSKEITSKLQKFGPLEVVDADGKPIAR